MLREFAAVLLKRAALTMLGAAVKLNSSPRGPLEDEELPDAPLPLDGGPRTPQAQSLVADPPAPVVFEEARPLEGSVEDRIAKARGGW